ncbi:MAG: response regulator receiver [Gemmatimonadetes bacterium]|nr:response regulator receiver [Gemmatimonadota bacterium]
MSSEQWSNEPDSDERDDSDARRTQPLVVLAEDNEDTRRVYCLILRHYGYRVEEATTGPEAIALTRSLHPSLVLMDIGLPELDGFQASRMLKSDPATSGIPLIAFSARVDSTADLVGGSPTFDGYILKPVSPRDLVRRMNAYLALLGGMPHGGDDGASGFGAVADRGEQENRANA